MEQHTPQTKPVIFFAPHYVGSLKYFGKLLPHLSKRYDVKFLLIFGRRSFTEMINFAKENRLPFEAIYGPKPSPILERLPFYRTVTRARHYTREVGALLSRSSPSQIIGTNDQGFYMRYLIEEANRRGVKTSVLQWALTYPGQQILPVKNTPRWRKVLYRLGKPLYVKVRDGLIASALGNNNRWSKGMIGGGSAKRFGVINGQALELFAAHGIPREKMTVVGYLDFHWSKEIEKRIEADQSIRRAIAEKHDIDLNKENIIFYSTPFNRKDTVILSDAKHRKMTETVIQTIREICPPDQYGVLFKPHPSETKGGYQYLAPYSVTFLDPVADNNELIALADLYIAGVSTTNFIPITMNKKAIFVNLAKLRQVESARPFFGIKKFVTEPAEFRDLLTDFKRGKLEPQYSGREKIIVDDSLQKIIDWIG